SGSRLTRPTHSQSSRFSPRASWIKSQITADDQLHDFARPGENRQTTDISIDFADSVFFHVSIAAVQLDGLICDSIHHLTKPVFGHRNLLNDILACDVILNEVVQESSTQLNFGGHISQSESIVLKVPDGFAKRFAYLHVIERFL